MANYNPLHFDLISGGKKAFAYLFKDNFNAIKDTLATKLNIDSSVTQTVQGTVLFDKVIAGQVEGGATVELLTTDLNLISTAKVVAVNDTTLNKPTATGTYIVRTETSNVAGTLSQIAIRTNGSQGVWRREAVNSVWTAWRQQATQSYVNTNAIGAFIQGAVPFYASATTVTMPALQCMDSTRSSLIACAGGTLNFASVGLNGLDAGSVAANTWYYCHAILNPTTSATGYIASTSSTAPTLPSGFTIRRLLPFVFKTISNSTSLQLFRFHHAHGVLICDWLSEVSRPDVVIFNQSIGSATPFAVDASSAIPPICGGQNTRLLASFWQDTGTSTTWSRLSTDFDDNGQWNVVATAGWVHQRIAEVRLSSNARTFRVRNDASGGGATACTCIIRTLGYVFNYLGVI